MRLLSYTLMNAINKSMNPDPERSLEQVGTLGHDLVRPECVLATAAGDFYTADWRGGVAHLHADGRQSLYSGTAPDGIALKPNGIALLRNGDFLLTHLGNEEGGVYRLQRSGQVSPWLMSVDGVDLPPTNFVVEDGLGRFWITVSTRLKPRSLGYRRECNDGFIVMVDGQGARMVADGLGYTNEVAIHPNGRWLYVNETFSRRLSRFALHPDGTLGPKEVVVEFGAGTFPDGLAFDEEGGVWIVSIISNRLIRVAPDGTPTTWLEDSNAEHLAWVEAAYEAGALGRPHLDGIQSRVLRNISSIAFCGPERRSAVLGCLLADHLFTLPMPVAGIAPTHWNYPTP